MVLASGRTSSSVVAGAWRECRLGVGRIALFYAGELVDHSLRRGRGQGHAQGVGVGARGRGGILLHGDGCGHCERGNSGFEAATRREREGEERDGLVRGHGGLGGLRWRRDRRVLMALMMVWATYWLMRLDHEM